MSAEPSLPRPEDIQLIVSDVDGTLLDSQHNLHPRTHHALHWLRSNRPNLPIVIATGKQRSSVREIREPLKLEGFPACHLNGCLVYGPGGALEHEVSLEKSVVLRLYTQFRDAGVALFFYDADFVYEFSGSDGPVWGERLRGYGERVQNGDEKLLAAIESGSLKIIKAAICQEQGPDLEQSRAWLKAYPPAAFTLTQALPFCIEIIPATASKGHALKKVLGTSIDPLAVLAFGDGENDVSMFKVAGYSVAVDNAMEIAHRHSTHRTLSNDQGGVGAFLEQIYNFTYKETTA